MEQHEADLIRDLIAANRNEIISRLDDQTKDIAEIKARLTTLEKEYDAVLVAQLVNKRLSKMIMSFGSLGGTVFAVVQILLALHVI